MRAALTFAAVMLIVLCIAALSFVMIAAGAIGGQ